MFISASGIIMLFTSLSLELQSMAAAASWVFSTSIVFAHLCSLQCSLHAPCTALSVGPGFHGRMRISWSKLDDAVKFALPVEPGFRGQIRTSCRTRTLRSNSHFLSNAVFTVDTAVHIGSGISGRFHISCRNRVSRSNFGPVSLAGCIDHSLCSLSTSAHESIGRLAPDLIAACISGLCCR